MALQLEVLATKPDNLNLSLTNPLGGKDRFLPASSKLHTCAVTGGMGTPTHMCSHTHKQNKIKQQNIGKVLYTKILSIA